MTTADRAATLTLTALAALTATAWAWLRWDNRRTIRAYRDWNRRMETR